MPHDLSLQERLVDWYRAERRDLPWRKTRDPYAIWVSEIMLQQTQVATVIPYWERWMQRFPDVSSLAQTDEQEVLALWQGLGYYRRCRMLLEGARFVAAHGQPLTAEEWRRVPGVGAYTAGAIASIALGEPAALVDGNVERVYARLTADRTSERELNANAWRWARENVFSTAPGDWNQALMELGATVCTPSKPSCPRCPVSERCRALAGGLVGSIPTKSPKAETVCLEHLVWVPIFEGLFGLWQIPAGAWWAGMWEFPRVESSDAGGLFDSAETSEVRALRKLVGPGEVRHLGRVRHMVTRHKITIHAFRVDCLERSVGLTWFRLEELAGLPLPAPQRRVLKLAGG